MAGSFGAVSVAHEMIAARVKPGALCIDATAGRGNDTVFLGGLVGEKGRVLSFDIQPEAVASTRCLIEERGLSTVCRVFNDSHVHMDRYAEEGSVTCITFNLGWLPGGSHEITTKPDTTIEAIDKGLILLVPYGLISICLYYGHDTGSAERDALLKYFSALDSRKYVVMVGEFVNRPNNPPLTAFIFRV